MRNLMKLAAAAVAVTAAVTISAAPAQAYTAHTFLDGSLPRNTIASEGAWRTEIGGDITIVLNNAGWGLVWGTGYIANDSAAGDHWQAQASGGGTSLWHSATINTWSSCWWTATTSGTPSSVPAICRSFT